MNPPSTTDKFLREMHERASKRRQRTPGLSVASASPDIEPYLKAAAVLHVFDPNRLQPVTTPSSDPKELLATLIAATAPAVGFRARGLRMLPSKERLAALRSMGSRSAMRDALAANPGHELSGVQKMFETWLDEEPFDLDRMTFDQLECLRQLYDWGVDQIGGLPDRNQVDRARSWRSSVRVFEHLVDRNFVGRERELAFLGDHVAIDGRRGPLIISGVGGAGKTALIGRFLIDHLRRAGFRPFPFAYLPFDAETLDVREPYTVLLAAARQLSAQWSASRGGSTPNAESEAVVRFQEVVASYRDHRGSLHRRASTYASRDDKISDLSSFEYMLYDGFADLVTAALDAAGRGAGSRLPALLVFDTFEEVAYRAREDLLGFWGMLDYLLNRLPELRVVIAGRARPPNRSCRSQACRFESRTWPAKMGSPSSSVLASPIRRPRGQSLTRWAGIQLSLRLAAVVANAEGTGHDGLAERGDSPLVVQAIGSELVRGLLYRRLLDHIHDPDVRALAHPGMVLRRVTPQIIEQVLGPACELDVPDRARADDLFEALRQEQALVSVDTDGSLRYREEVRHPVLELLARETPTQVKRIHQLAVAYYTPFSGAAERAEELYHRMMLQQPEWQLQDRWLPEVERFIASAIDEIPVSQRRWLAGRMSLELAPEIYQEAELSEWERLIGRKALELVRFGDPQSVLRLLADRSQRTADSPLYAIEARAWLDLGEPQSAEVLLDNALAGYPMLGNPGRLAELLWLRAQAARQDPSKRLAMLERLRRLVADFRSQVAHVQVLTEVLGVLNPDDLNDSINLDVSPTRGELASALAALSADEMGREPSLIRLALVRLRPALSPACGRPSARGGGRLRLPGPPWSHFHRHRKFAFLDTVSRNRSRGCCPS